MEWQLTDRRGIQAVKTSHIDSFFGGRWAIMWINVGKVGELNNDQKYLFEVAVIKFNW